MLLSWPVLIFLCWVAVRTALVIYENRDKDQP
jgi:hypothetical protein